MSSENNPEEENPPPAEEDLDSDVGTIFSDEEEGKQIDDDDGEEGGVYSDDDSGSSASSESDDGSEKCPICLQRFTDQEIGTPEMCEHQFCLRCITAWSKKVATCPIDRKFFSTIMVKKQWDGEVVRIEDVKFPNAQANEEEYDSNPTYCEVCGRCDREERLLLCDGCDLGYHLECLDPPLEFVPIDDWFCPSCVVQGVDSNDDEVESSSVPSTRRSVNAPPVRIPRTRLNERILQSIEPLPEPSAAAVEDVVAAVVNAINNGGISRPVRRKRTTKTRKRKSTSKRKSTKAGAGTSGTRRKRRSRRRTKRRRRVAVDKRPNTARGRIAHHLGITPPLPGQVYMGMPPASRACTESTSNSTSTFINSMRYNAGITPLRMFGGPAADLSDLVDTWSDEESPTSSARAGSTYPSFRGGISSRSGATDVIATAVQPTSCDVLGSILKKQYILLNDKNVKITRDGTLVPSMSSSTLPTMTATNSTSRNLNKSLPSPEYPSSSNSPTRRPKMTVCGTTGGQESISDNSNRHQTPVSSSVSDTHHGNAGGNNYRETTGNNNNGQSGSGSYSSDAAESWTPQQPEEDEDVDIYSDIEEQDIDSSTPKPDSETNEQEGEENSEDQKAPRESGVNISDTKPHESPSGENDESDGDMVIDEEPEITPPDTESEAVSRAVDSCNINDENTGFRGGSPDNNSASTERLSVSPESIPLPDSPPPIDVTCEETENSRIQEVVEKSRKKVTTREKGKYDPSDPLTSSDEEESSNKNLNKSPVSDRKDNAPITSSSPKKGLNIRRLSYEVKSSSSKEKLTSAAPNRNIMLAKTNPLPSEDHQNRRPGAIQFSIPKRHNLIPISSLMKRQKGVAKKDSNAGANINFQSEISKAFGNDGDNETENQNDEVEGESAPRSLVAEIFGSDDEEEQIVQNPQSSSQEEEKEREENKVAEPKSTTLVIDVNSGRWKTVSEVPVEPVPSISAPKDVSDSSTSQTVSKDANKAPEKVQSSEDDPEIIEIVTLNCPPKRKRPRRLFGHSNVNDVEMISETPDSDIEIIDEVLAEKQKSKETGTEKENDGSRSASRTSSRHSERKRRRRRSHYSSDGNLDGNGEDRNGKVREKKRKEKKRHSKERDRSSPGSSSRFHDDISSGDDGRLIGDAEDLVSWKRRRRTSRDRHYRRDMESDVVFHRPRQSHEEFYADRERSHFSRSRSRGSSQQRVRASPSHRRHRLSTSPYQMANSRSPSLNSRRIHSGHSHGSYPSLSRSRSRDKSHKRHSEKHMKETRSRSPRRRNKEALKRKAKIKIKKLEKIEKAKRKLKELKERKKLKMEMDKMQNSKLSKTKKKRKREKSLSPVKAIKADGDSIVVSLSFQTEQKKKKEGKEKKLSKKRMRKHSPLVESKVKDSELIQSESAQKSVDLGAEDLSSNSEEGGINSNNVVIKGKELCASNITESVEEPSEKKISRHDRDHSHYASNADSSRVSSKRSDTNEFEGDSLVTSTRDLLEPSGLPEDDLGNVAQTPPHSKTFSESSKAQNVSSTERSPRVHNSSKMQSQTIPQDGEQNLLSAGIDLLNSASTAAYAAAMNQPQGPNYPVPMLNPVLATVASALFAARHQATRSGGHNSSINASSNPGKSKASSLRSQNKKANLGGGGDASPISPNSSDGDDFFEPPTDNGSARKGHGRGGHHQKGPSEGNKMSSLFDELFGNEQSAKSGPKHDAKYSRPKARPSPRKAPKKESFGSLQGQPAHVEINFNSEEMPASAVELSVQEKLLKKLNRQERVVEEVKLCLKPHYIKKHVNKEEYKEILRRAVPKVCHSKTGEINPFKIRELVEAYVKKFRHSRKKSA